MALVGYLKEKATEYTCQIHALYIACRDPRTPWPAKAMTALVVAYALSPIDLIPDFIPVLGYLDDLILLPLGIMLVIRLIPPEILKESRKKARSRIDNRLPRSRGGVILVVSIWIVLLVMAGGMMVGILK